MGNESCAVESAHAFLLGGVCYLALGQGLLVLRYRQLRLQRIHDMKTYRKTWQARRANHPIAKQQTLWKTIKSALLRKTNV